MEYNQNYDNYTQQPTPPKKANGLAIASLVCGILSLIMCCLGIGLPLGALAILFAILTRHKGQSMNTMSISGIITGALGLFMGLAFTLYSLYLFTDPYFQRGMYDSFESVYGEEIANSLCEIYGFDLDEIKELDIDDF